MLTARQGLLAFALGCAAIAAVVVFYPRDTQATSIEATLAESRRLERVMMEQLRAKPIDFNKQPVTYYR